MLANANGFYIFSKHFRALRVNALWPNNTIWSHGPQSTVVHVLALLSTKTITRTTVDLFSIGHNFKVILLNEKLRVLIQILLKCVQEYALVIFDSKHTLFIKKMNLKLRAAKWRSFCLRLRVLIGKKTRQSIHSPLYWDLRQITGYPGNVSAISVFRNDITQ